MIQPSLILIGAGGHARSCIDVIEQHGKYRIIGLIGLPHELDSTHFGYEVIGSDEDLMVLFEQVENAVVGIGQIKSAAARTRSYYQLRSIGFKLPLIVSPRAYVSRYSQIGDGTIVMHDALVNSGAKIGVNCIINTKALIEHDAIIEDHCHISTGSIVNGATVIGKGSFIGSNAMIANDISISEAAMVGGGSVVLRSLNKIELGCTESI